MVAKCILKISSPSCPFGVVFYVWLFLLAYLISQGYCYSTYDDDSQSNDQHSPYYGDPNGDPSIVGVDLVRSPCYDLVQRDSNFVEDFFQNVIADKICNTVVHPYIPSYSPSCISCAFFEGECRLTRLLCEYCETDCGVKILTQNILDSVSSLDALTHLSLNLNSPDDDEYLDKTLQEYPSIPTSWGNLNELTHLSLKQDFISGPVPCELNASKILQYDFTFSGFQCYPLCLYNVSKHRNAFQQNSELQLANAVNGYNSVVIFPETTLACPNNGCSPTQYADLETLQCSDCPAGSIAFKSFSYELSDCISIATNMYLSMFALIISVVLLFIYVYFGRIHRISFIRVERVVHTLIKRYKATMSALDELEGHLKAESKLLIHLRDRWHVVFFWLLTIAGLLFLPIGFFAFFMFRRLLDVLILWNGWKDNIHNYTHTVDESFKAIGKQLKLPVLFAAIFYPFEGLLELLSKIRFNLFEFGAIKITCLGAQAPFLLLVQIIVFVTAIIIINSDYQVFKTNLFSSMLEKFLSVTASRGYRKIVLKKGETFCRYLYFLFCAGFALMLSIAFDFQTILQYCISLVKFDALNHFVQPISTSLNLPDWQIILGFAILVYAIPFFFSIFIFDAAIGLLAHVLSKKFTSTNVCNNIDGFRGLDSIMASSTFLVSISILIPIIYEVGKTLVPGNRIYKRSASFHLNQRIEPWKLTAFNFFRQLKQNLAFGYERSLWMLSFVSGDLYIATLAEKWLAVIHHAIPAITNSGSLSLTHATETSSNHSPGKHCFGLNEKDIVFSRIFDAHATLQATPHESSKPASPKPYTGEFNHRGEKHGYGIAHYDDGTYEGFFKNNKFSGFGRYQWSKNTIGGRDIYIGMHKNGKHDGVGLMQNNRLHQETWIGQWKDGKLNGLARKKEWGKWSVNQYVNNEKIGTQKFMSKSYDGERNERGQRHGRGCSVEVNMDIYVGDYCDDKRQGYGILFPRNCESVYAGDWYNDVMHGNGLIFYLDGDVQKGIWTRGIKGVPCLFAQEPAVNADEEEKRWQEFKDEGSLPTYSEFVSLQYQRSLTVFSGCLYQNQNLTRLLAKLLSALFVWYGFANFFDAPRRIWKNLMTNYFVFLISAVGIWTWQARVLYSVIDCIKATSTEEEAGESDVSERWAQYTRAWESILAPRFVLFMLVPSLTPVSLFATTMVSTPIFVDDPEVPLPPWLDFGLFYRRASRENPDASSEDQDWIVVLESLYLFTTESRIVQTVLNVCKFSLSIALWRAGLEMEDLTIDSWMTLSLIVFLPYCYLLALQPITLLGKVLNIKNEDVFYRPTRLAPSTAPSPTSGPNNGPNSSNTGETDEIPGEDTPRPTSATIDFSSTYLGRASHVVSPLAPPQVGRLSTALFENSSL